MKMVGDAEVAGTATMTVASGEFVMPCAGDSFGVVVVVFVVAAAAVAAAVRSAASCLFAFLEPIHRRLEIAPSVLEPSRGREVVNWMRQALVALGHEL